MFALVGGPLRVVEMHVVGGGMLGVDCRRLEGRKENVL